MKPNQDTKLQISLIFEDELIFLTAKTDHRYSFAIPSSICRSEDYEFDSVDLKNFLTVIVVAGAFIWGSLFAQGLIFKAKQSLTKKIQAFAIHLTIIKY